MPTFFNPAAGLTANRIPYALGGGRLGDSPLTLGAGLVAAQDEFVGLTVERTGAGNGGVAIKTQNGAGAYHIIGTLGTADDPNSSFFIRRNSTSTGAQQLALLSSGALRLGQNTSDLGNGRIQFDSHTVAGSGLGFFDFSLYRDGAGSLRTNATSFRVSGQLLADYGTFSAPAFVPGDSGAGMYVVAPGGGRCLFLKGYGGRTRFRRSDNGGDIMQLTDAGVTVFSVLGVQGNLSGSSLDVAADAMINGKVTATGGFFIGAYKMVNNPRGGWGAAPGDGARVSLSAASSQADHNAALRALIADLHGGGPAGCHYLLAN